MSKEQGCIYLDCGIVVHCEVGGKRGEEAFYDILRWEEGQFSMDLRAAAPEVTMDDPVEYLLFRGARHLDEQHRGKEKED